MEELVEAFMEMNEKNLMHRDIKPANILIHNGKIKIVYMSPEYMINGYGIELANKLIQSDQLKYFAIDESHCLSAWGHDFRPSYIKLQQIKQLFPDIPIMAVTATAKEEVVHEIIKYLGLKDP